MSIISYVSSFVQTYVYFFVARFLRHLATILSSGDEWNVQDYILCRLGGGYVGGYIRGQ